MDKTQSQVLLEIFRNEIRWYHFVTPEARNIVTDRVRTDAVRKLAEAGRVDIGTAEPGGYSVPSLIQSVEPVWCSSCGGRHAPSHHARAEGPGSTSPEPGPAKDGTNE